MVDLIINKAPGKNLIPIIIEKISYDDFYEFYKIRVDWYGYPLIHDRFVTYGLFDDLSDQFQQDKDCISSIIDFAIIIAEQETDKRFLNSIFLILDFCGIAKEVTTPTAMQIERIIGLCNRVKKLSFFPNMTTFWDQILNYLSLEKTFNKEKHLVKNDDYLSFINMNFPTIDDSMPSYCPVNEERISYEIEGIVGEYEPLKFIRSAKIDSDKYWLWLYKNISGNVWSWYITVKQNEKDEVVIEKHNIHGGVTKTPEKLLLDYHYNI